MVHDSFGEIFSQDSPANEGALPSRCLVDPLQAYPPLPTAWYSRILPHVRASPFMFYFLLL